jgi:Acyl-CoA carboxylase epsilon subunit
VSHGDPVGETSEPQRPVLFSVTSDATPEEVAALVAVLGGLASSGPPPKRRPRSVWASPQRSVRHSLPTGPGGWRTSSLPR